MSGVPRPGSACSALSSPNDPISSSRRRDAWAFGGCLLAFTGCVAWAVWPLGPWAPRSVTLDPPAPGIREPHAALDLRAFDAPIWVAPPTAPVQAAAPPEPPPKPAPPVRLQLVGIIREAAGSGTVLRAAVYDPDLDKLLILSHGQRLGDRTVSAITEHVVELSDGRATTRLRLEDRPRNGGGS
jgi:hypothetical protein